MIQTVEYWNQYTHTFIFQLTDLALCKHKKEGTIINQHDEQMILTLVTDGGLLQLLQQWKERVNAYMPNAWLGKEPSA